MQEISHRILDEVKKTVIGKDAVVRKVYMAILAGGHILLEDIPGVGKTTLALAFAGAMDLRFRRLQFTPDVTPSDITGYSVPDAATGKLLYRPGAAVCNLFLGDEINRASPKTQSALLEVMEEGQVTVENGRMILHAQGGEIDITDEIETMGSYHCAYDMTVVHDDGSEEVRTITLEVRGTLENWTLTQDNGDGTSYTTSSEDAAGSETIPAASARGGTSG